MAGKTEVYFAHSAGAQYGPGKGSYDLVKYLKSELSQQYRIIAPVIEKPNSPVYDKFRKMFQNSLAKITAPVILVGHSLGGSTLLKYLSEEKPKLSIEALFLVSAPFWKSNMKEFQLKEDFQKSLKAIPKIYLYHSKNDVDVPIESLESYEQAFPDAVVHRLAGKEHIFSKGLPQLISDIRSLNK